MQQHQHTPMHQVPPRQLGYNEWLTQQQHYAGYGPDAQQYLRPPQQPQQQQLQQYQQQQELTEEQKKLHEEELQRQAQMAKDLKADRYARTLEIQKSMGYYQPGLDKLEYWTGYPQARKRDDNGEATYPRLWHDRDV